MIVSMSIISEVLCEYNRFKTRSGFSSDRSRAATLLQFFFVHQR